MMHVAESYQIINRIAPSVLMMLTVMKFEHFPRIVRGKHPSVPTAFNTLEPITLQNRNPNRVSYETVVFVSLPIFLKEIHTDS